MDPRPIVQPRDGANALREPRANAERAPLLPYMGPRVPNARIRLPLPHAGPRFPQPRPYLPYAGARQPTPSPGPPLPRAGPVRPNVNLHYPGPPQPYVGGIPPYVHLRPHFPRARGGPPNVPYLGPPLPRPGPARPDVNLHYLGPPQPYVGGRPPYVHLRPHFPRARGGPPNVPYPGPPLPHPGPALGPSLPHPRPPHPSPPLPQPRARLAPPVPRSGARPPSPHAGPSQPQAGPPPPQAGVRLGPPVLLEAGPPMPFVEPSVIEISHNVLHPVPFGQKSFSLLQSMCSYCSMWLTAIREYSEAEEKRMDTFLTTVRDDAEDQHQLELEEERLEDLIESLRWAQTAKQKERLMVATELALTRLLFQDPFDRWPKEYLDAKIQRLKEMITILRDQSDAIEAKRKKLTNHLEHLQIDCMDCNHRVTR